MDDDLNLTPADIENMLSKGEPVRLVRRPAGWSCDHFTLTSPHVLGRPIPGCGCQMRPLVNVVNQ